MIQHSQAVIAPLIKTDSPATLLMNNIQNLTDPKGTLVLLDIDETTITPESNDLGTSAMFYDFIKKLQYESPGIDKQRLVDFVDPLLIAVYQRMPVRLIDKGLPDAIKAYQKIGAMVIGLTARGERLRDTTEQQLKTVGIKFSDTGFLHSSASGVEPFAPGANGLIMTGPGLTKGEALTYLVIKIQQTQPVSTIIMIDDGQHHLESAATAVKKLNHGYPFMPVLCTSSKPPYNSNQGILELESFIVQWHADKAVADLIKTDPFTKSILTQCVKRNSPHSQGCQSLIGQR